MFRMEYEWARAAQFRARQGALEQQSWPSIELKRIGPIMRLLKNDFLLSFLVGFGLTAALLVPSLGLA